MLVEVILEVLEILEEEVVAVEHLHLFFLYLVLFILI
jgi:hypothetical protein